MPLLTILAVVGEGAARRVAHAEAAFRGGNPQAPQTIFSNGGDVHAFGAGNSRREGHHALAIVPVQPVLRADPDVALVILEEARDGVVTEAIVGRDVLEPEILCRKGSPSRSEQEQ